MKTSVLPAVLLSMCVTTGCATPVYEVAVGVNTSQWMPWSGGQDGGFQGPRDTFRMTVRQDIGPRAFVSYSHISHLSTGWPINDRYEDWLDVAEFGVRFGGAKP
jgi:hypothetical protein